MFKYTKAAINLIINNLKLYGTIMRFGASLFSISYYIYSLISKTGNMIVNITLIILIGAYLIFETITLNKNIKSVRKVVHRSYKYVRLAFKAFTLGSLIYSIYLTSTHVNALRIILTTLMVILFIIEILFEIIRFLVEHNADFLFQAIKQDYEEAKKPVNDIRNVFRKMKGENIIQPSPKSKKILKLEKRIQKLKKDMNDDE